MKAGDTGVVISKELSQKFVRMGELKKQRNAIFDAQEKAEANKGEQLAIKDGMKARIDKFYNTEESIPKAMREAEKAFQTASGNYKKE
jgi:tRNA A58 N-methylase Trm61